MKIKENTRKINCIVKGRKKKQKREKRKIKKIKKREEVKMETRIR